jgi:hypothetical protein
VCPRGVCEEMWWRLERRETAKGRFYHLEETDRARNLTNLEDFDKCVIRRAVKSVSSF